MLESLTGKSLECRNTYKHFQTEGHKGFVNEVPVTFIDKTDGKDPKKKKKILDANTENNGTLSA